MEENSKGLVRSHGSGIFNTNVVGFAVSIANNTDADNCMAQSNAAVITAGGNVESRQWNQTQKQHDD
jgi:hypothetical protein